MYTLFFITLSPGTLVSNLDMDVALFRTGPGTCLTANTLFGMGDGHDFVAHIVTVLVITLKRLFDQVQNFPAAYLVAAATANALMNIDRLDEFRHPDFSAPGISYDFRHIQSLLSLYSF
jgi:hypothetical protein